MQITFWLQWQVVVVQIESHTRYSVTATWHLLLVWHSRVAVNFFTRRKSDWPNFLPPFLPFPSHQRTTINSVTTFFINIVIGSRWMVHWWCFHFQSSSQMRWYWNIIHLPDHSGKARRSANWCWRMGYEYSVWLIWGLVSWDFYVC